MYIYIYIYIYIYKYLSTRSRTVSCKAAVDVLSLALGSCWGTQPPTRCCRVLRTYLGRFPYKFLCRPRCTVLGCPLAMVMLGCFELGSRRPPQSGLCDDAEAADFNLNLRRSISPARPPGHPRDVQQKRKAQKKIGIP